MNSCPQRYDVLNTVSLLVKAYSAETHTRLLTNTLTQKGKQSEREWAKERKCLIELGASNEMIAYITLRIEN